MDKKWWTPFTHASRPLHVLTSLLVYALGAGIANYLGRPIQPGWYVLGQIWVLSLQIGMYYLGEALGTSPGSGWFPRPPFSEPQTIQWSDAQKQVFFYYSAILLALTAALTVLFSLSGVITLPVGLIMGIVAMGYGSSVLQATHQALGGLWDLIHSFVLIVTTTFLGFSIQTGQMHHFLLWSTFVLFCLHVAMMIVFQLPRYGDLERSQTSSIITFLGWKRAMQFHHILLTGAFYLVGIMALSGYPPQLVLPVLLALPFAVFQSWYLMRIASGVPVKWNLLLITAVISFGFTGYLLVYVFWTR